MQTKDSFRFINLLFLIVLLLQASNIFFLWMPQYIRLTLNQAIFVFLPAYLYLRLTRQPILSRVGWRWPGWKAGILALLLGMGLYPLSAVSAAVLQQVLGYTAFDLPADVIPTTTTMGILAIIAYAIMAPLCEEFLFRGVIQPIYEKRSPRLAIFFVGLLFIVFHLSLLQGLSIILLALVLGFVYYRTRSLQASILTHFGANMLAALVLTQSVFPTGIEGVLFSAEGIFAGVGLALLAFLGLLRIPRPDAAQEEAYAAPEIEAPERFGRPAAFAPWWPLLVAGIVYMVFVGIEIVFSRGPGLAAPPLEAAPLTFSGEQTRYYNLYNVADEQIGEGECRLASDGELVELTCESTIQAYEVRRNGSYWSSVDGDRLNETSWRAEDGQLYTGRNIFTASETNYRSEQNWRIDDQGIWVDIIVTDTEEQHFLGWEDMLVTEAYGMLVISDQSGPWQLSGMDFEVGFQGSVLRFHPYTWRPETQDSGPVVQTWLIRTAGADELELNGRVVDAWRLNIGSAHSAWYKDSLDIGPVQFFNGMETWVEVDQ